MIWYMGNLWISYHDIILWFVYLPVQLLGNSCQVMELLITPESKIAAVIGSYIYI